MKLIKVYFKLNYSRLQYPTTVSHLINHFYSILLSLFNQVKVFNGVLGR